ncbi:glycoside hydrolase family 68 protein [Metabacillus sediminilitoris]|uniref:Glycoside hydrolase family 68 protein n=1 Tax=Metabacillus sediminilitoris TaxID=2567941 RepID=A0A4S4BUA2_9BACI|nr:glycoside hydrolase family 68 protein [Metabacillus sediminilitoris]QGQ44168.1 glycoside hydrolase family 68 protein [Metabacillus sediminilitoris]THF78132.1 glycoside hydrolase family 68 protein [Metabacillus sediminilitoris]
MNFKRFAKQATVVTLSTAILLGAGESLTYAKETDSRDHNESYGISHITRSDMHKMIEQQGDSRYTVPQFDESKIKNIPSAKGYDELGNLIDLDVWDTWPLQNADGTVANYNGYQIVFGLAGDPDRGWDTFIYMFYKKIGDTGIDSWKNAGRVFKDTDKFKSDDPVLRNQAEEWSGSATLTEDGKVRLFYTNRHGWDPAHNFYGKQTLTTAQINVSEQGSNTLKVDGIEDHKSIFDGDEKFYQTVEQAFGNGDYSDNHTLRDPHYIEENGHKYLVFEANTGTETGYQGEESLFNKAYYGGSDVFFQNEKSKLLQSPKKDLAQISNGALGIIEINDDYTLKSVMKPLVASNTVTDEIERPNIFKKDGKWYLFTSSRGSKMTIDGIDNEDIYLLGYVSDSLTGPYKPLNKTGLVLHHDLDPYDVTWNYAHFAIPQEGSDNTVVTSYMTNRGYFEEHKSTFAPSFQLNINGDKTSVVENSILEQGQVTIK